MDAARNSETNFVVSPFSIWSLMTLITEGATEESYAQLKKTLNLPNDLTQLRTAYKQFQHYLSANTNAIQIDANLAVFSDRNRQVENNYLNVLENEYGAKHLPVDFRSPSVAAKDINDLISLQTHGKIRDVVKPNDISNSPRLLLTSSVFFKGAWKVCF